MVLHVNLTKYLKMTETLECGSKKRSESTQRDCVDGFQRYLRPNVALALEGLQKNALNQVGV